jgi:hypothetical protein
MITADTNAKEVSRPNHFEDGGGVAGGGQQLQVLQRRLSNCDEWDLPHHPRGPPVCVSIDNERCKYR